MKVLIIDCFHWLGFHLTTKYLDEGFSVTGVDTLMEPRREFLCDFVGRNANFILQDDLKKLNEPSSFSLMYSFSESTQFLSHKQQKGKRIRIFEKESRLVFEDDTSFQGKTIFAPHVIGPWMEQSEFARKSTFDNVLYVEDFVNWLFQEKWNDLDNTFIDLRKDMDQKTMNTSIPSEQAIQKVQEHIDKFTAYYRL